MFLQKAGAGQPERRRARLCSADLKISPGIRTAGLSCPTPQTTAAKAPGGWGWKLYRAQRVGLFLALHAGTLVLVLNLQPSWSQKWRDRRGDEKPTCGASRAPPTVSISALSASLCPGPSLASAACCSLAISISPLLRHRQTFVRY